MDSHEARLQNLEMLVAFMNQPIAFQSRMLERVHRRGTAPAACAPAEFRGGGAGERPAPRASGVEATLMQADGAPQARAANSAATAAAAPAAAPAAAALLSHNDLW